MGGGNAAKSAERKKRNNAKKMKAATSKSDQRFAPTPHQCEVCRRTFQITVQQSELEGHAESFHAKKGFTFEQCFPKFAPPEEEEPKQWEGQQDWQKWENMYEEVDEQVDGQVDGQQTDGQEQPDGQQPDGQEQPDGQQPDGQQEEVKQQQEDAPTPQQLDGQGHGGQGYDDGDVKPAAKKKKKKNKRRKAK